MVTVEQVKAALAGKEPDRGGYGSKFEFKEHPEGVVVELHADWKGRSETPKVLVTKVDGGDLTFRDDDNLGGFDPDEETETAWSLAETLGDSGDY